MKAIRVHEFGGPAGFCVTVLLLCSWVRRPRATRRERARRRSPIPKRRCARPCRGFVRRSARGLMRRSFRRSLPPTAARSGNDWAAKLPLFRVEKLAGFFAMAVSRAQRDAAQPAGRRAGIQRDAARRRPRAAGHGAAAEFPALRLPGPRGRRVEGGPDADSAALARSRGRKRRSSRSAARRSAGSPTTRTWSRLKHFLIFAHTGPLPAQQTAQLLEELYDNFQPVFPFDLGLPPPANPPADAGNPARTSANRAHRPGLAATPPVEAAALPFSPGPDPYMIVFLFSYHQTYLQFAERHDPAAP